MSEQAFAKMMGICGASLVGLAGALLVYFFDRQDKKRQLICKICGGMDRLEKVNASEYMCWSCLYRGAIHDLKESK